MAEPIPYFRQYSPVPESSILINIDTPTTFRPSAKSTPQLPMTPPAHESSRAPSAASSLSATDAPRGDVKVMVVCVEIMYHWLLLIVPVFFFQVHESPSEKENTVDEFLDTSEDQSFNEKQIIKKCVPQSSVKLQSHHSSFFLLFVEHLLSIKLQKASLKTP